MHDNIECESENEQRDLERLKEEMSSVLAMLEAQHEGLEEDFVWSSKPACVPDLQVTYH